VSGEAYHSILIRTAIKHCAYCGEAHDLDRDHVIPTSYLRERRSFAGDWLVPACKECNSTLGNLLLFTVPERAAHLITKYKKKYRKFLLIPNWNIDEIAKMHGNLRIEIIQLSIAKSIIVKRIEHLEIVAAMESDYLSESRPRVDWVDEEISFFAKRGRDAERAQNEAIMQKGVAKAKSVNAFRRAKFVVRNKRTPDFKIKVDGLHFESVESAIKSLVPAVKMFGYEYMKSKILADGEFTDRYGRNWSKA
jgi:hypothetical protein